MNLELDLGVPAEILAELNQVPAAADGQGGPPTSALVPSAADGSQKKRGRPRKVTAPAAELAAAPSPEVAVDTARGTKRSPHHEAVRGATMQTFGALLAGLETAILGSAAPMVSASDLERQMGRASEGKAPMPEPVVAAKVQFVTTLDTFLEVKGIYDSDIPVGVALAAAGLGYAAAVFFAFKAQRAEVRAAETPDPPTAADPT